MEYSCFSLTPGYYSYLSPLTGQNNSACNHTGRAHPPHPVTVCPFRQTLTVFPQFILVI